MEFLPFLIPLAIAELSLLGYTLFHILTHKNLGNCETGLAFDVQRSQTPDFVGDEQEKVDGDTGKVGMEGKQTEKRAHE